MKDYEVIAPLRSGGMAMLYLARRRGVGGFSRLVALKLVHPHLVDDETIHQLFLNEARISAAVAHPNVVNVEEVGKTGGRYFMAMEYVHGVSLAELLASLRERRLRMSQKLCVWVVAQIAEALHAVHEATSESGVPLQIVHHDVSPQNVLIGHTGHVKLIDFGIAKSVRMGNELSSCSAVLGKPAYMAPEQLHGQGADRRSDVYALGVMLWEMLTARSLFRSQQLDDERDWALRERPVPPSRYAPISSSALDEAVLKALAPDPRARFESAFELRGAILRADASAALVDAPSFAALMRSMLGHELDRQREKLPRDVSLQIDRETEEITNQRIQVEELTAEVLPSDGARDEPVDAAGRPTLAAPPSAQRGDASTVDVSISEVAILVSLEQQKGKVAYPTLRLNDPPQRDILTMPLPSAKTQPSLHPVPTARRERSVHATWVGIVCWGLGMASGAAVSGKEAPAERAITMETVRPPPAPEVVTKVVAQVPRVPRGIPVPVALTRPLPERGEGESDRCDERREPEESVRASTRRASGEHRRRSERSAKRARSRRQ